MQYAQAGELTPEQARQMIANAQNPHPGVSPGMDTQNDWVGRVFADAYVKGYAETMIWLAFLPAGGLAPEAAAGARGAESLAVRAVSRSVLAKRLADIGFGFAETYDPSGVPSGPPTLERTSNRFRMLGRGLGHIANYGPEIVRFLGGLIR